jgi:hypothetical protein
MDNLVGTRWEFHENALGTTKNPTPHLSPREEKCGHPWVHAHSPHWLQKLCFLPTCVLCHFGRIGLGKDIVA